VSIRVTIREAAGELCRGRLARQVRKAAPVPRLATSNEGLRYATRTLQTLEDSMAPPKNSPRGKRSSAKARARREEQLDLFPQELRLAPAPPRSGSGRRGSSRNDDARKRVDSGVLIQLGLH
jgi:hypothetical protein